MGIYICTHSLVLIFSSAVSSGSGAFQMPTRPAAESTLRGGMANLRNA